MKFIPYVKLRQRLVDLGYRKIEIRSTVRQIRRLDRDIKQAVYFWLNMDILPKDSDPALMVCGQYSVETLCETYGIKPPAAFILLQISRQNPDKASEMLYTARNALPPDISQDEISALYEKFGICEDNEIPADEQQDIPISDDAPHKGEEGDV